MATLREEVIQVIEELGKSMNSTQEVVPFVPEEHADALTLPGVVNKDGNSFYVQAPLQVFLNIVSGKATEIQNAWVVWFGADATTEGGVQKQWMTLSEAVETATSLANEKAQLADGKATLANTAADKANTAAERVETAVTEANNVNAELDGMTVIITNRQGQSKQTNIGFEIYKTYKSVAEMQSKASEVPEGKFVMIATTDPTSTENAQLWAKNSAGGFTFLSDLDQAASHAWADWLENHKQQIIAATNHANEQGDYAKEQGDYAKEQGGYAKGIYDTVRSWFNGTDNNGFKATSENWLSTIQQTWESWFSDSLSTGVRKIWKDFYTLVTTTFASWKTQEQGRVDAESARVTAEQNRAAVEQDRVTAETERSQAESQRAAAEQQRNEAETQRNTNEQTRQLQEEARQRNTDTAISNAEDATRNANTQALYATEQGNWAKLWGDHPPRVNPDTNYWQYYNPQTEDYEDSDVYAKGEDLDWDSMTEEEQTRLVNLILAHIIFASEDTSKAIVDELV